MRIKTLKNQLILFFVLMAFVPLCILVFVYFSTTMNTQRAEFMRTRRDIMQKVSDNLDDRVRRTDQMMSQIAANSGLENLINRNTEDLKRHDLTYMGSIDYISSLYRYTILYDYAQALLVEGYNGLDIRYGAEAALYSKKELEQAEWFQDMQASGQSAWGILVKNPWKRSSSSKVVPFYKNIYSSGGGIAGYLMVLYNSNLLNSCYRDAAPGSEARFLLVDRQDRLVLGEEAVFSSQQVQELLALIQIPVYDGEAEFQFTGYLQDGLYLITAQSSLNNPWVAVEIAPMAEIQRQNFSFIITAVSLGAMALLFSFLLSILLSRKLTGSLQSVIRRVKEIGEGQLRIAELPETGYEEIHALSHSINLMQNNISLLMEQNIMQEKEKRGLEILMLQNQINPHFLYNTINTIKLMATLQGSLGIEKMLASLNHILSYALNESSEKVPLSREFELIENYMYIQKIRYKGRISCRQDVSDNTVLSDLVPRFILQPVVENCIIHGFSENNSIGEVELLARNESGKLVITVRDNGIGMSPQQLAALRFKLDTAPSGSSADSSKLGHGIGTVNVHRRIKLIYGEDFGLRIDSEQNKHTTVLIVLKLETGGTDCENTNR